MSEYNKDGARDQQTNIDEAAAHWLVQLQEANLQSQASVQDECARWCEADPRHAEAFARMQGFWDAAGDVADTAALSTFRQDAIEELERLRRSARLRSMGRLGLGVAFGLTSAATLAVAVYLTFWPTVQTFSTGIGERRTFTLADRSRVELDADSALSVHISRRERFVRIVRGEAFFMVAKDAARPFIVEWQNRTVTATGTAFDVEALADGLKVTLVQGHVAFRAAAGGPIVARLDPGDSLTTELGKPLRLVHDSNTLALLAWRAGHVMFDDVPLSEAVARMERYTRTHVVLDPSLAELRFSGVFKAGDVRGMIGAVETYYHVRAENSGGTVRLTRRR